MKKYISRIGHMSDVTEKRNEKKNSFGCCISQLLQLKFIFFMERGELLKVDMIVEINYLGQITVNTACNLMYRSNSLSFKSDLLHTITGTDMGSNSQTDR